MRSSFLISGGSFMIFFSRPVSAIMLGIAFVFLVSNLLPFIKKRHQEYNDFEES
jgi:TctA family transporter